MNKKKTRKIINSNKNTMTGKALKNREMDIL